MDMDNYNNADVLLLEAKQIQEKTLGKNSPDYSVTLDNLARWYKSTRQYEKAESPVLSVIVNEELQTEELTGTDSSVRTHSL